LYQERSKFEGGYGPIAEDAIQAVETELVSVNAALERLAAPAPGLIEQARARAVARLQALQAGVLSALSRSRLRLRQSLVVERGRAVAALRATVRTARRRLRQRGQIATIALDNVIVEVRGAIGGEAIPFLPGVRDVVARAESALSLHASSFDVDGDVLVDETHRSVADVVQTAEAGLQARAGSALAQADASAQRGLAQAGEVQASARARSDAILAQLEGRGAAADARELSEGKGRKAKAQRPPWEPPPWLNLEAWREFEQHRRELRKPLTDRARDLNAKLLRELTQEQQQACIEASIAAGWTGLFPDRITGKGPQGRPETARDAKRRELAEEVRRGIEAARDESIQGEFIEGQFTRN